jgi:hypothetical protein
LVRLARPIGWFDAKLTYLVRQPGGALLRLFGALTFLFGALTFLFGALTFLFGALTFLLGTFFAEGNHASRLVAPAQPVRG